MDDKRQAGLTEILKWLSKPDPELSNESFEADERRLLAIVNDTTADRAARAAALDELTGYESEGRKNEKALGMQEGRFGLSLYAETVEAVLKLAEDEDIFLKPDWKNDPLGVAALNFLATMGESRPDYPVKLHKKVVDELLQARVASPKPLGNPEPS